MGESEEGACCVGVALEWPASSIRAAISLSSPAARFPLDDLPEVAAELLATARDVAAAVSGAG
jgi:DNA-binding IclR family transcriptional regulator